jgi:ABC-type phosphate transport system permease subunit
LDRAVPAQKKTKPQRAKIVVLSCIFITILTTFYIFIKHHFEQIQAVEEEEYKSWLAIAEWLKKDLASIPWKKTLFRKK